ncbi:MAG: hypothetical protein ACJA2A_002083 [Cycloclasticus pugetii]|jgi:hypothetical protein
MTTLFKHVVDGLEENFNMNDIETLCDGIDSGIDAIDIMGEGFNGETSDSEMEATIKALDIIVKSGEKSYYEPICQKAIQDWNIEIWGQDFGSNNGSEPFGG